MKKIMFLLISILASLSLCSQNKSLIVENIINNGCVKDTILVDLVPNENTAKKIAEAIWLPIYGEKILKQRPYQAILLNDIWIVRGLIPEPYRDDPNVRGGTAYIEIRKKDSKVLKVTHGR